MSSRSILPLKLPPALLALALGGIGMAVAADDAAPRRAQLVTAADLAQVPLTLAAQSVAVEASTETAAEESASPSVEINAGSAVAAVPKRFQYAFRLNARGVYDDNIFLRQFDKVDDYYFAIEPGVTLGFGDIVGAEMNSIRLDYAPSIFIYSRNSAANAVQHLLRLEGNYHVGHLTLGLAQDVQILNGTNPNSFNTTSGLNAGPTINIDAGGNTEVNIYTTRGNFSYDLTGKTFLSGGGNFTAYDYKTLIGSEQITGNLFLNYIYSPKLTVGLGGTVGYTKVEGANPDQLFEQANVRLTYQLTGKVSLDGSVGVEFRQFDSSASSDTYVSPVYQLGATYQPFDGTTITLSGSRRTQNSAVFAGQDYTNSSINVSVRQRFLRRFYLGLAGGYEHNEYFSTLNLVSSNRSDDYYYLQPSVDFTVTRYWTAGAYYLHRRDDSTSPFFNFENNQVGLRTSFTF